MRGIASSAGPGVKGASREMWVQISNAKRDPGVLEVTAQFWQHLSICREHWEISRQWWHHQRLTARHYQVARSVMKKTAHGPHPGTVVQRCGSLLRRRDELVMSSFMDGDI